MRKHSPALLAVDVTQALGRIPLDLDGVDLDRQQHAQMDSRQPRRRAGRRAGEPHADWTVPAGGWFNLQDAFGPDRFDSAVSKPGRSSFTVGMPNYPAVYAIRAGLDYLKSVGPAGIYVAGQPLTEHCLKESPSCRSSC